MGVNPRTVMRINLTMMMRFTSAAGCLILLALMSGCTYDDLETIGSPVDCDVFDVSYGQNILPLVADNCQGCLLYTSPSPRD